MSLIQVICSHKLIKGDKKYFHWDKSVVKEVFHFGKWIFFCSILAIIYSASDKLLLAALVDAKNLGVLCHRYVVSVRAKRFSD